LHSSLLCRRRPPEVGAEAHRNAYLDLMLLLSEPARHEGSWQLLEPRDGGGGNLIGCLWSLPLHHSLLLVVNAGWQHAAGALDAGPLAARDQQMHDFLAGGAPVAVSADTL